MSYSSNNHFGTFSTASTLQITQHEIDQISNIGNNSISPATWGFLSAINQGLSTSSSPTFSAPSIRSFIDLYDPVNTTFKTTIKPVSSHLTDNRILYLPDNDLNLTFPEFMYFTSTVDLGLHWNLEARGNRRWQFLMDDDTSYDGLSKSHNLRLASILDNDTTFLNVIKFNRATGAIGINIPQTSKVPDYQIQCNGGIGLYSEGALAGEDLVNIDRHSNDGHGAYFNIKRSAGTLATPATLGGAATLGGLLSYAYTTEYKLSSSIYFDCTAVSGADHSSNISFYTCNVGTPGERMRISPDGKVGIGTYAPSYQLDVSGDININNEITSDVLRGLISRQFTTDAAAPLVAFFKSRGTKASPTTIAANDYIGGITTYAYTNASKQGASILFKATAIDGATKQLSSDIEFYTVNVGTSTEKMKLDKDGILSLATLSTAKFKKAISVAVGSPESLMDFTNTNGYGAYVNAYQAANSGSYIAFKSYDYNYGSVVDRTILTLSATGLVGIGTATPTEALDVVGTVKANSLKINATFSQYIGAGATATLIDFTSYESGVYIVSTMTSTYFWGAVDIVSKDGAVLLKSPLHINYFATGLSGWAYTGTASGNGTYKTSIIKIGGI